MMKEEFEENPNCPHCKAVVDAWDVKGLVTDLDSVSVRCQTCGGPIKITVRVDYRYRVETTGAD